MSRASATEDVAEWLLAWTDSVMHPSIAHYEGAVVFVRGRGCDPKTYGHPITRPLRNDIGQSVFVVHREVRLVV
jgi:hypothetical protein